jgi:hypothetical protein
MTAIVPRTDTPLTAPSNRPAGGVHGHHLQRASETPSHGDAPRINREKGGGNPLTNGM